MTDLPNGWEHAPIGSLCTLNNGRAFKPSEWQIRGIPIVRIQNLNNPSAPYNHFLGEFDARYHLRGGELLFAWSGTPGTSFGAHVWRGAEAVLNQHIFRVDFDEDMLDKRYFRFAINQRLNDLIGIAHGGVGLRHVTKGKFEQTHVSVPPLNEQKRIADKLDAVLARVDACREHLDRVPDILKRFRQAALAAAVSGRLTADWRAAQPGGAPSQADPKDEVAESAAPGYVTAVAPDSAALHPGYGPQWWELPLVDLCEKGRVITYGVVKLGNEVADGVPCLRTSNIRWLRIDTEGMKRIDELISASYSRTILHGGEVLVNVRGTLGGVAVAEPEMAGWNVSREVAVVPADNKLVAPSFLAYWIGSDTSQRWLGRVEKGVAYVGINIEDLRNLPVGIPSLEEQQEIVRRVETLFAYADRLEARYAAARAQVEHLTPALLAKAFRGELVPQDPDDEPASVLLERIRAERAAAPAKPKRGRVAASSAAGRQTATPSQGDQAQLADIARPGAGRTERGEDDQPNSTYLRSAIR
ncbi:MAG: restriction endonuclease subunit S [Chromatiaceae bacterium]